LGWELFFGWETVTDELLIRPVEPKDEKAIAHLWQALSDYHVQIDARLPGTTPGAAERYASRLIERRDDPATRTCVAQVNGHVVGYVLGAVVDLHPDLFEHVDVGFIADIYVDPVYRRQGIARRLVETLNQWFGEQGVEHTELQVSAVNTDGQRFWEAVGGSAIMVRMRMDI
jgi:ribosomal protein S18 acetylase RimI-like enzyme